MACLREQAGNRDSHLSDTSLLFWPVCYRFEDDRVALVVSHVCDDRAVQEQTEARLARDIPGASRGHLRRAGRRQHHAAPWTHNRLVVAIARCNPNRTSYAGPDDTPYEGGFFYFLIRLNREYPIKSPRVTLLTTGNNKVRCKLAVDCC